MLSMMLLCSPGHSSSLEAALTRDYSWVEGLPTNSKVSSELPAGGGSFLEL